jgi:hypothetical protein
MATEVWLRNPKTYIREIVEVRHPYIAWDRGFLVKHRIDPSKFCDLYFPADVSYRMLVIGDTEQGAMSIKRGGSMKKPDSVFPVWLYGEQLDDLEALLAHPVGENYELCNDTNVPVDQRPVFGQEHRVVVSDIPNLGTGPGRKFIRLLHEMQLDYPDAIIHVHGLYAFKTMFGLSFRATDIEPRMGASKGNVYLPNGREVSAETAVKYPQWVNLLGVNPVDLKVPRNRCMFSIRSALWASRHFKENVAFKSKDPLGTHVPNTTAADTLVEIPQTSRLTKHSAQAGDRFACDSCSLTRDCKYYREGAVCSVPDAETNNLADFFNTRDSATIIQGLGLLLGAQANRLERGIENEDFGDELDPEVSKMINSLFANGVKLAKLTNPELNGGPKVGVFVNGGNGAQVAVGQSASQLTAAVVRELEAKGIPRDQITPEMIGKALDPTALPAVASGPEHGGHDDGPITIEGS